MKTAKCTWAICKWIHQTELRLHVDIFVHNPCEHNLINRFTPKNDLHTIKPLWLWKRKREFSVIDLTHFHSGNFPCLPMSSVPSFNSLLYTHNFVLLTYASHTKKQNGWHSCWKQGHTSNPFHTYLSHVIKVSMGVTLQFFKLRHFV